MSQCEQCHRLTDYLFAGIVVTQATRYVKANGKRPKVKAIGLVDVHREGLVCFRCRPPSNVEIEEMLEGVYAIQRSEKPVA